MLASVESDKRRKVWNAGNCDADGGDGLWCARYDSRPLLKAKEPSGRAESARRRSAWRAMRVRSWEGGSVAITDLRHLRVTMVSLRHCPGSVGLLHPVAVSRDRLSRLGGLVAPKMVVSSCAWER